MNIAVYSGSFNPLHIGHQAIMEYLTFERHFDWIYLVVSPKNPLKSSITADSGSERYEAAVKAVKRHPKLHVWVDDIELKMSPPQYTIKTLDALKAREPENDFTLVIGADNLSGIRNWRDFARILTDYGVAVYPRKGYDMKRIKTELIAECLSFPTPYVLDANYAASPDGMRSLDETLERVYNITLLDAPIVDISSTEIREGIKSGKDMSKWLM